MAIKDFSTILDCLERIVDFISGLFFGNDDESEE